MAMHDGVNDGPAAALLLQALLRFLESAEQSGFDGLVSAVGSLPAPPGGSRTLTWPNVTILPFLADPTRFMVLKPEISKVMAQRMNYDLLYSPEPRWHTYATLQDMASRLLTLLAPFGARDFVDVQSFMWVTRDIE